MVDAEWTMPSGQCRMVELNCIAEWPSGRMVEVEWPMPNDRAVKIEKSIEKSRARG